jgi:two-component system response regulator AdeR
VMGDVLRAGSDALPQPLVLVVEDDHDTRVLLRATLEGAGYVVVTAANGRDAMLRLAELPSPPRLLLIDLRMPVMDGWELLASLRQDARWAAIPIGVQSANVDITLPQGISFVLGKPVDVAALLALVRHHCG